MSELDQIHPDMERFANILRGNESWREGAQTPPPRQEIEQRFGRPLTATESQQLLQSEARAFRSMLDEKRAESRARTLKHLGRWAAMRFGLDTETSAIAGQGFGSWKDHPELPDVRPGGWWLYGPEGTGKTTAAAILCVEMIRKYDVINSDIAVHTWSGLYAEYNEAMYSPERERRNPDFLENTMHGRKVLVLDDVIEREERIQNQLILFRDILNAAMSQSITLIVTSNIYPTRDRYPKKNIDGLAELERRQMAGAAAKVTSRLLGYCVPILLDGDDRRQR